MADRSAWNERRRKSRADDASADFSSRLQGVFSSATSFQHRVEDTVTNLRRGLHDLCRDLQALSDTATEPLPHELEDDAWFDACHMAVKTLQAKLQQRAGAPALDETTTGRALARTLEIIDVDMDENLRGEDFIDACGRAALNLVQTAEEANRQQVVAVQALENYARDTTDYLLPLGLPALEASHYLSDPSNARRLPTTWIQNDAIPELAATLRSLSGGRAPAEDIDYSRPGESCLALLKDVKEAATVAGSRSVQLDLLAQKSVRLFGAEVTSEEDYDHGTHMLLVRANEALASLGIRDVPEETSLAARLQTIRDGAKQVESGDSVVPPIMFERWIQAVWAMLPEGSERAAAPAPGEASASKSAMEQSLTKVGGRLAELQAAAEEREQQLENEWIRTAATLRDAVQGLFNVTPEGSIDPPPADGSPTDWSLDDIAGWCNAALDRVARELDERDSAMRTAARHMESERHHRRRVEEDVRKDVGAAAAALEHLLQRTPAVGGPATDSNDASGVSATHGDGDAAEAHHGEAAIDHTDATLTPAVVVHRLQKVVKRAESRLGRALAQSESDRIRLTNLTADHRAFTTPAQDALRLVIAVRDGLGLPPTKREKDAPLDDKAIEALGPMRALTTARPLLESCLHACNLTKQETTATTTDGASTVKKPPPTPEAVVDAVRASSAAINEAASLTDELIAARESEKETSEFVVAMSQRLRHVVGSIENVERAVSRELAAAADSDARFYEVGLDDSDEPTRHHVCDEVPEALELSTLPATHRMNVAETTTVTIFETVQEQRRNLARSAGYLAKVLSSVTSDDAAAQEMPRPKTLDEAVSQIATLADRLMLAAQRGASTSAARGAGQASGFARGDARPITSPDRPRHSTGSTDEASFGDRASNVSSGNTGHRGQAGVADHRLVRFAVQLQELWAVLSAAAQVKYFYPPDDTPDLQDALCGGTRHILAPTKIVPCVQRGGTGADLDVDVDQIIPELEDGLRRIDRVAQELSRHLKATAIAVKREADTMSVNVHRALTDCAQKLALEEQVEDVDEFRATVRSVSQDACRNRASYFQTPDEAESGSAVQGAVISLCSLMEFIVRGFSHLEQEKEAASKAVVSAVVDELLVPACASSDTELQGLCDSVISTVNTHQLRGAEAAEAIQPALKALARVANNKDMADRLQDASEERDKAQGQLAVTRAELRRVQKELAQTMRLVDNMQSQPPTAAAAAAAAGGPSPYISSTTVVETTRQGRADTSVAAHAERISRARSGSRAPSPNPSSVPYGRAASNSSRQESLSRASVGSSGTGSVQRVSTVDDARRADGRVSRHLQRSHYFDSVVGGNRDVLDNEISLRARMSPPRRGTPASASSPHIELSPPTPSDPRRSSSARRSLSRHTRYTAARLSSGLSSVPLSSSDAQRPAVGGGPVRVMASRGRR